MHAYDAVGLTDLALQFQGAFGLGWLSIDTLFVGAH